MEETNYDRKHQSDVAKYASKESKSTVELQPVGEAPAASTDLKKANAEDVKPLESTDYETGEVQWPRKTFRDKLSLRDNPRPNRLVNIMIAPFKGFSYPAVVYAG